MSTAKRKKIPIFRKSWENLKSEEKDLRMRSLEVVSEARTTKKSLTKIARQNKLSVKMVLNHTNAFKKINRRWVAKKFDKISRSMIINEKGKKISIEINDSRHASTVGKYHNAVKEFKKGNKKKLSEFSKKKIRDSNGKLHSFETRPKKIISVEERVEEPEFVDVYEFE
ncbi:hypothetical protein [Nitrosopumilus sp.]|uniref:hypothetical protein n=1 Tax=Nitrosopumilus sp. TaxID=2024843 RepID=UPI00247CD580|nr:hypothetical protein [Nitrosopumilus sp.]MCV0411170.1 hypothetical protein [Nitrosopumilus sp.]